MSIFQKLFGAKPKDIIPRRQLTVESSNLLSTTMTNALTEMLKTSCPCQYPRFKVLTSFLHDNYNAGPVFCADTNYLIGISTSKELQYLQETNRIKTTAGDFDDIILTCTKCASVYHWVERQYSINFQFSYLLTEDSKIEKEIGAKVTKPIPLLQGLFGFKDEDILKCAKDFKLADATEVYNYLTEKINIT